MKAYTIKTEFDASDKYIVDNIIARKNITLIVASPKKARQHWGLILAYVSMKELIFLKIMCEKQRSFTIATNYPED
ncbi:MAG: hypothetical protein SPI25_01965 [Dialister sp.]|nr:hypothetical protein [Dialister sp.]